MIKLRTMKVGMYFLMVMITLFAACQNEDDVSRNDSQALTEKKWTLYSEEIIHISDHGRLESIITDECKKDDVYYFNVDGNYEVTLGHAQCQNESSELLTGTWDWWVDDQGILFRVRIISVSPTTLKARMDFSGRLPLLMTFTAAN